jgi:hypothetical protein
MPPAVFIDLGLEPFRQRRRGTAIRCVADRAGRAGGAAGARVRAFPWFFRMVLADPAAALATGARRHANSSAPAWVNFT